MTAKQLVDSPAIKLAAYALMLGIAWATLKAEVAQKADKATVEAMAADIRDIKSILCHNNTDSFCR
jgi:hypothetical protein